MNCLSLQIFLSWATNLHMRNGARAVNGQSLSADREESKSPLPFRAVEV